jgi:hypothetical protein
MHVIQSVGYMQFLFFFAGKVERGMIFEMVASRKKSKEFMDITCASQGVRPTTSLGAK